MSKKPHELELVEERNNQKNNRLERISKSIFGYMRLNKKIFIIFSIITILMLNVVYLVTQNMFLDSFKDIEERETRKQIRQVVNILVQDTFHLNTFNKDYAGWDSTYDFIKDKNYKYIKENLLDDTFSSNEWNVFILVDTEGSIVYKKAFDLVNQREAQVSSSLLNQLNLQSPLLKFSKPRDCATGIISLPEGFMMVSAHPVVTSGFNGDIRGWLVLGRYVDDIMIDKLKNQTQMIINIEKLSELNVPKDTENIQLSSINTAVIWSEIKDKNHISGYSLIYDIYNKPAFLLRVDREREIYRQVKLSINYFMGVIIFIGIMYFIATWFFMNKFIFRRLNALMDSVNEISNNKDLSKRVSLLAKDEFSTIESEFNRMLDTLEESQNKIIHKSQHDDLTDLPNRAFFYEKVNQSLEEMKKTDKMALVLFIDIDKFKIINDLFGHEIGDCLLQTITKRLDYNTSYNSIISRIGADEFVIYVPGIEEKKEAEGIARKIIDVIKEPYYINNKQIIITLSAGISLYPRDGNDVETLINNADIAMFHARKEKKGSFKFYTAYMRNRISVDMIYNALENNEFELYYQPKINAETEAIEGMEALIRWKSKEFGMVSPMEFIPLAEETGLIVPIGKWILYDACAQNKRWQDEGYPPVRVAVNISAIQFMQADFVTLVKNVLDKTGLEGKYLELEITESIALYDEEEVINKLSILKKMGITVSIDDFGTGYSSLSYLERLPVDSLKIDKSFIRKMFNDSTIVRMIIGMAKSLEINVVAEGVETKEQLNYLLELGCKYMQGYLFSKPLPANEFERLLDRDILESAI